MREERSLRKGITPVVATVLLLGITVAIGLTVYTQAQGLISEGADTGELDKAQNTDLDITSIHAYDTSSSATWFMNITVENSGDRAVNTSEFSIYYGPPNYPDPVAFSDLPEQWAFPADTFGLPSGCFEGGNKVIPQGEEYECVTWVKFPDTLEEVEIEIRADEFEFEESAVCDPKTKGQRTC